MNRSPELSCPRSDAEDDLSRGTLRGPQFRILRALLLRLITLLLGLRLEGVNNVPPSGPLIVVCNHLHNADPMLLSIAFPRPLHFMAKEEAFANPIVAAIIRRVGAFPVGRGKADRGALRRAEATLRQGIPIGIFPEGTRSRTGRLQPAQGGVGLLALRTGVPIVPIAVTGSERLPFNGRLSQRVERAEANGHAERRVTIRIGPPFVLQTSNGERRLSSKEATERIMGEIVALLPPSYRGSSDLTSANPTKAGLNQG